MDNIENIDRMKPFADKWKTFGWNVLEIDGHNHAEIKQALLNGAIVYDKYRRNLPRQYVNLGILEANYEFQIGKAITQRDGKDVMLIGRGVSSRTFWMQRSC
ncbi:MAG: hypothetical protein HDR17_13330 [Lachnospiraceae bacterium]|nr:hypothetical protein [Lachnospiraceae bacterium]